MPEMPWDPQTRWMSRIVDDINVTRLTIPGSHDSHATEANVNQWNITTNTIATQWYSIAEQLRFGVRYLDLRCSHGTVDGEIIMCHGDAKLHGTLGSVLDTIAGFLGQNPSETVLVSIKWDMVNEPQALSQVAYNHWNTKNWWKGASWPNLGQVRGQAVLLRHFNGGFGVDFGGKWGEEHHDKVSEGKYDQQNDGKFGIGDKYLDDINKLWRLVWNHLDYSKGDKIDSMIMHFNDATAWAVTRPRGVSLEMNPRLMRHLADMGNANIDPKT